VAAALPLAPQELAGAARKEWYRVGRLMRDAQMISKLDRGVLATYCVAWARWLETEQNVRKHGLVVKTPSGFPQLNPYLVAANRAMQQIVTLSSELGLSPSSRHRLQTMGTEDGDDAFERFRQERRRPPSS
jgi:P27 family predicted phage terminase small subunit